MSPKYLVFALFLVSCTGSTFSGKTTTNQPPSPSPAKGGQNGEGGQNGGSNPTGGSGNGAFGGNGGGNGNGNGSGNGNLNGGGGLVIGGGGTIVPTPRICDMQSITFVSAFKNGVRACPQASAVFSADDNETAFFGCCPLPASDILLAQSPIERSGRCLDQEVVVGVGSSGSMLLCAAINTQRYRLGTSTTACYYGSGQTGQGGSRACGAPPQTLAALAQRNQFGSDACLGSPWGSLFVSRGGKECSNMKAAQLLDKDGIPVKMVPD